MILDVIIKLKGKSLTSISDKISITLVASLTTPMAISPIITPKTIVRALQYRQAVDAPHQVTQLHPITTTMDQQITIIQVHYMSQNLYKIRLLVLVN
jgi:hypothetical protein